MDMPQNPQYSRNLAYLVEIETLAQDILTLKETKLELANVLNKLRESLRALQQTEDKRSLVKVGSLFVEYSTEESKTVIRNEMDEVQAQYDSIHAEVREKLMKKRDLEHEPQIRGLGLRPFSYAEVDALRTGFGIK